MCVATCVCMFSASRIARVLLFGYNSIFNRPITFNARIKEAKVVGERGDQHEKGAEVKKDN